MGKQLHLEDINEFIQKNNLKPVTSTGGRNMLDPKGPLSEDVFGRLGSRERKTTFGYVDLKCKVIHPSAFPILTTFHTELTKLILGKQNYDIVEGIPTPSETGRSGIHFFITNFDQFDWEVLGAKKPNELKFIQKNKEKIIISNFLILPAGIRDIQTSKKSGKTMMVFSEITQLYERLIRQTNNIIGDIELLPDELISPIVSKIQDTLMDINRWIIERMQGKKGLMRGGLLRRVVDYCGRMVITPDPKLKLGYIGISWQMILKLFEPFTIHHILKLDQEKLELIKNHLGITDDLDINDIRRFISTVNAEPNNCSVPLQFLLKEIAETVTKNKVVVYKRDPTENRDTWQSCYVRVDPTGFIAKLNPYDLEKNGGDFDGDTISIYSILTDEAQEQAKKEMCARHSKGAWRFAGTANNVAFTLTMDSSTAIYAATKK